MEGHCVKNKEKIVKDIPKCNCQGRRFAYINNLKKDYVCSKCGNIIGIKNYKVLV